MRRRKNNKGSAIAFGAALALFLVVLGLGFLAFSMYMGAQNETKNAVDAGALNLGKQVIDKVSVKIDGSQEQQFFNDVTENGNGVVNLRNIDRVWAKAMFVGINADGAGSNAGNTSGSVEGALSGAQEISDALAAKLIDANNMYGYFSDFANANSVRMIGTGAGVAPIKDGGWQTSLMQRTDESNIQLKDNLPIGYTLNSSFQTPCTRKNYTGANGMNFLKGYVPMKVANQTYWQVPFQYDEKPHLVSETPFDKGKLPPNSLPATWDHPVPNAFSVHGQAQKTGAVSEQAMSWVLSNPRQPFPMQFPNGFIRVVLKQNTIQWHIDGIPVDSSTYEFSAGSEEFSGDGIPYPFVPICATGSGDASCGNEYVPPVLYIAIVGNTPPVPGTTMQYLLQRCKEMVPDCTMTQLTAALMACPISSDDADQTFFIYPQQTPVGTAIVAMSDSNASLPSGCDKSADPEGSSQTLDEVGPNPVPNTNDETFLCNGVGAPFPWLSFLTNKRTWKPGTGYPGGCLGELTVHHTTDAEVSTFPCTCP